MSAPDIRRDRYVRRQYIDGPFMLALSLVALFLSGLAADPMNGSAFALSLIFGIAFAVLGYAFAFIRPDDQELSRQRELLQKRIARLERAKP